MHPRKLDWTNTLFIVSAHLLAVWGVVYMVTVHFAMETVVLAFAMMALCGLAITGGYHRLFAHPTYKTGSFLKAVYLIFGAAAVQNSALKWSADHRVHHAKTDQEHDPYNILKGFWWAHIGWVFFKNENQPAPAVFADLSADRLIRLQDRFYLPLAILVGAVLPFCLGLLWGDPVGALLVAGFLRLVVLWHATFSINSFAHWLGTQPYSTRNSARDSFITALLSLGEGYHNFHHRFQNDYRNGVRWFHFDPTKWFVWTMSKVGVTQDLRRATTASILRARQEVLAAQSGTRRRENYSMTS